MVRNYLTKSLFIKALECPTKMYYASNKEYIDKTELSEFYSALQDGGFQVEELARLYHPGGIKLNSFDKTKAVTETKQLLNQNNSLILYEPSIVVGQCYARIDILIKNNSNLELIEVKAKSIDSTNYSFTTNKNYIKAEWKKYLYDVAFQTYLMQQMFPEYDINPYLMLVDKSKTVTVHGLNQLIKIDKVKNVLRDSELTKDDLGQEILVKIPVKKYIEAIWNGIDQDPVKVSITEQKSFKQRIEEFSEYIYKNKKYPPTISEKCKTCEFRINASDFIKGKKNGFIECWKEALGWDDDAFQRPHIFDIWNFRQTQTLMEKGLFFIDDIKINGLKLNEIQIIQIKSTQNNFNLKEFLSKDLKHILSSYKFPFYFIDFETARFALPFNAGLHPYELIVFQFSIHKINEDGSIEHYAEWIDRNTNEFPNFEFVRQLMQHLTINEGTIFQYTNYEKNCLKQILQQLLQVQENEKNSLELMDWIIGFINSENLVDLCEIVKKNYYHPLQRGSFSIKDVIYAVVNVSTYLQNKYSELYYGTNFPQGIKWIEEENTSKIKNPYKLLPPLDIDLTEIKEGGAAMIAYGKLHFCDLSLMERQTLLAGLLRYCELDTLAMTMIMEYWLNPE